MDRWYLTIIAGIVCGVSFLTPFWYGAVIGTTIFLYVLYTSPSRAMLLSGIFASIVQGSAYAGLYFDTIPLPWLPEAPILLHSIYIGAAWIFTTTFATLPFLTWGYCYSRMRLDSLLVKLAFIPPSWICTEWLSAQSISLGTHAGVYSFPAISSSVGFLGNQLADSPLLLQLASLGGIYILSFLILVTAVFFSQLYLSYGARSYKTTLPAGIFLLFLFVSTYATFAPVISGEALPITLITTYTPSVFKITARERAQADSRILDDILAHQGSTILLPEATEFLKRNRELLKEKVSSRTGSDTIVIDSESTRWGSTRTRRAEYLNVTQQTSSYTNKVFLVPFGEYMPDIVRTTTSFFNSDFLAAAEKDRVYVPGNHRLLGRAAAPISLRMCNEIVSTDLYRQDTLDGATVLFNVAAHSWYHDSYRVERQILRAAKIRAVENHRYLALANSGAPSFALDWFGQIVAKSSWHSETPISVTIQTASTITPYVRFGSVTVLILSLPIGFLFFTRLSFSQPRTHFRKIFVYRFRKRLDSF